MKKIISLLSVWMLIIIIAPGLLIMIINLVVSEPQITVYNYQLEDNIELELDEYLIGVVAAEMPVSFPLEALKAQAVAARTYALKKKINGQRLTTASKFDQAWLAKEELFEKWQGNNFLKKWSKVATAVEQSEGLVMVYEDQLITAAYHSTSGGQTASAFEVWGGDIPYLSSVNSNYERESPYYNQQQIFSWSQLVQKLSLSSTTNKTIEVVERSNSERVLELKINGEIFSGREIREQLGLNSTKFDFELTSKGVKFSVDGFGHGVGMSQYGAQGLAQQGYDFKEILKHYYPKVDIRMGKYDFDV
ncbi:MAG: stage II sporulation protein D [Bacillota bacterium]